MIRTRYEGLCPESGVAAEIAVLIHVSTHLGAAFPNAVLRFPTVKRKVIKSCRVCARYRMKNQTVNRS
ncbi:hypothetical protein [Paenibacillus aceti]|uniref:hypothetical protein n=1 Tax=Paenibacillus aceti TaxID=1820010 RepID=UPI001E57A0CE|nr:hypothetical protein [Paenibacillus aceti]